MSKLISLKKGEVLFKEGTTPDCMYLIQKGMIAITKEKGEASITLAELKQGDLLGEMTFFDREPRSAGAVAVINNTEVMQLPFDALQKQFDTLPDWVKALMKSVNGHLRKANQKIRMLEKTDKEDTEVFPPLLITKLSAILTLIASQYGEKTDAGVSLPGGLLRSYTIQIFQQPTHKMQTFIETLQDMGYMSVENLGEGKQKMIVKNLPFLIKFTEFYNHHIFGDKKITPELNSAETKLLRVLNHYGANIAKGREGLVLVCINDILANSTKDLGQKVTKAEFESLLNKGILSDKQVDGDIEKVKFDIERTREIFPYWELISTLRSVQT